MKNPALLLASLAVTIAVAGCGGNGSSADYPADFKVVPGDSSATVTWTAEPDVEYWIFYGPGDSINTSNWVLSGGSVVTKATSPRTITGLANGSTYSFTINGRKNGGPGGTGAPTQVVVPRLAGDNWAPGTPLGTGDLNAITFGTLITGYTNVTVGSGGALYVSVGGGANTQPVNPAAPVNLNGAWFTGAGFGAAGDNGTVILSLDGTTWQAQTTGTTATLYAGVTAGLSGFVVVGAQGTIVTSPGGTTWAPVASGTANSLYSVTWGNGTYVAVGANGTILYSADGVTWQAAASGTTKDLRGVTFASMSSTTSGVTVTTLTFVAVGAAGTVLTSSDGVTWTAQAPISTNDLTSVAYGGQFVAAGKGGGIFTSPDGVIWLARTSGTTNDLLSVARTASGYTAVGVQGTNVSSF